MAAVKKVAQPKVESNQTATTQPTGNTTPSVSPNLAAARAAVVAVVSKWADQNGNRDDIPDGYANQNIEVCVAARIEGQRFVNMFNSRISVGHVSTRASSSLPNMNKIIGAILKKLNAATRESVMREVVAEFAENNFDLPEVSGEIATDTENMLKQLRASKPQTVRGSVSVQNTDIDTNFSIFTGE